MGWAGKGVQATRRRQHDCTDCTHSLTHQPTRPSHEWTITHDIRSRRCSRTQEPLSQLLLPPLPAAAAQPPRRPSPSRRKRRRTWASHSSTKQHVTKILDTAAAAAAACRRDAAVVAPGWRGRGCCLLTLSQEAAVRVLPSTRAGSSGSSSAAQSRARQCHWCRLVCQWHGCVVFLSGRLCVASVVTAGTRGIDHKRIGQSPDDQQAT